MNFSGSPYLVFGACFKQGCNLF